MSFFVYLLRCADESYYVGHTDNLESRLAQHDAGSIDGYTHNRRPVSLMKTEMFETRDEALSAEMQLKKWSRAKKEAWVRGDYVEISRLSKKKFK